MKIVEKKNIKEASTYDKKMFSELDKFVDKFGDYLNADTSEQYVLTLTILFGEYLKYAHKNMREHNEEYSLIPRDILTVFQKSLI